MISKWFQNDFKMISKYFKMFSEGFQNIFLFFFTCYLDTSIKWYIIDYPWHLVQGILPCIASELTTELSINQSQLKLIMWIVTKLSAVLLSYGYFVHWSIIMNIWTSFPNVPLSLFAVTTSLPPHWTISTHHFSRDAKTILRTGPLRIW